MASTFVCLIISSHPGPVVASEQWLAVDGANVFKWAAQR